MILKIVDHLIWDPKCHSAWISVNDVYDRLKKQLPVLLKFEDRGKISHVVSRLNEFDIECKIEIFDEKYSKKRITHLRMNYCSVKKKKNLFFFW